MFGIPKCDPWIGPEYKHATLKLLVLGESRYDEDFTDHKIIKCQIDDDFTGGQRRTFTNFELAILARGYSETDRTTFWRRTIFYNYNLSFFPGKPRVHLKYEEREKLKNGEVLQKMLTKFRPTHAIVWGKTNFDSIVTGPVWKNRTIPRSAEPCFVATVDGNMTLFTGVHHPAAGFSSKYWHPIVKAFLALKP
jgi:hypothetical protein